MTDQIEIRQIAGVTTEDALRTARCVCFVPGDDGGLQLEVHAGGVDLEINIERDGRIVRVQWEFVQ